MAKQPTKQQTAPNSYTRQELEALSSSTGIPVDQLWVMPRRQVQTLTMEAARLKATTDAEAARLKAAGEADTERRRALAEEETQRQAGADKRAHEQATRPSIEQYPWLKNITTTAAIAVPPALGFAARRYAGDQKLIRQWDKANDAADAAKAAARSGDGTVADAAAAVERAQAFATQYQAKYGNASMGAGLAKDGFTLGGGTALASEIPALPALADSMMYEPGTRAYDEAKRKMGWGPFAERFAAAAPLTVGTTAAGLKAGTLMNRNPAISQARTSSFKSPEAFADDYNAAATAQQRMMDDRTGLALLDQDAKQLLRQQSAIPQTRAEFWSPRRYEMEAMAPQSRPLPSPAQSLPASAGPSLPPLPQLPVSQSLPPPAPRSNPGAGDWAEYWSQPARDIVRERAAAGSTMQGGRGGYTDKMFAEDIGRRLPPGIDKPSNSEVNKRRGYMSDDIGLSPSLSAVEAWLRKTKPERFALPVGVSVGGAYALSPEAARALWDEQY